MPARRRRISTPLSFAVKLGELGVAAPQVIAHRVSRMAAAGSSPSARDRKEFTEMVVEKQLAFGQAWLGMWAEAARAQQAFAATWMRNAMVGKPTRTVLSPGAALRIASSGLAPVHKKAVANAKRLSSSPKRAAASKKRRPR